MMPLSTVANKVLESRLDFYFRKLRNIHFFFYILCVTEHFVLIISIPECIIQFNLIFLCNNMDTSRMGIEI